MDIKRSTLAVVANPVGADDQIAALREALAEQGLRPEWYETTESDPGAGQARAAIDSGVDVVIACGGDGTIRSCIESLAGSQTAVGIVPAGTGNLLCRNLRIPDDPRAALDVALNGRRRTIDVGYANGHAFAVMAGAGLDAAIMRDTSRAAKDNLGSLAYVGTALRHLRDGRVHCTVTADGSPFFTGPVATVLAANFGSLQAGIDLFPDADPSDGKLELMTLGAGSLGSWLRSAFAILTDREPPNLINRWSRSRAEVTFAEPMPYQVDGEERPATSRLVLEIWPQSLSVCVPGGDA